MTSTTPELLTCHASGRPVADVLAGIATAIHGARSLLLTAHVRPDGDALGSGIALALGLRHLGKSVRLLHDGEFADRYRPLVPPGLLEDASRLDPPPDPPDLWVVLDTSEPSRVGCLRPLVFAEGQRRVAIDHHASETAGTYDHHLLVPGAPATGSLVLRLLDHLGVEIRPEIARALWIAIATDTGWFRFGNTSPLALRDAARLVEAGAAPEPLWELAYGEHSLGRTRLLGEVLRDLRSELDGDLVVGTVLRSRREAMGVALAELDGYVDHVRSVRGARVAALVTETDEGGFKVSLRSRGDTVVEPVARAHGGGGHAQAAGFSHPGPLADLERALVDGLRRQIST